jgi:hypothetical protein
VSFEIEITVGDSAAWACKLAVDVSNKMNASAILTGSFSLMDMCLGFSTAKRLYFGASTLWGELAFYGD